jgi:hypothetical protein
MLASIRGKALPQFQGALQIKSAVAQVRGCPIAQFELPTLLQNADVDPCCRESVHVVFTSLWIDCVDGHLTGIDALLDEWKQRPVLVISVGKERADVCALTERRPCETDLTTGVSRRDGITGVTIEGHKQPPCCGIRIRSHEWHVLESLKKKRCWGPHMTHNTSIVPL